MLQLIGTHPITHRLLLLRLKLLLLKMLLEWVKLLLRHEILLGIHERVSYRDGSVIRREKRSLNEQNNSKVILSEWKKRTGISKEFLKRTKICR